MLREHCDHYYYRVSRVSSSTVRFTLVPHSFKSFLFIAERYRYHCRSSYTALLSEQRFSKQNLWSGLGLQVERCLGSRKPVCWCVTLPMNSLTAALILDVAYFFLQLLLRQDPRSSGSFIGIFTSTSGVSCMILVKDRVLDSPEILKFWNIIL